jgi:hypothetical protein
MNETCAYIATLMIELRVIRIRTFYEVPFEKAPGRLEFCTLFGKKVIQSTSQVPVPKCHIPTKMKRAVIK